MAQRKKAKPQRKPLQRIDVRKLVEPFDDKARLELCNYAFSVLTEKSQMEFMRWIEALNTALRIRRRTKPRKIAYVAGEDIA